MSALWRLFLFLVLALTALPAAKPAQAGAAGSEFGYQLIRRADGSLVLRSVVYALATGQWLGVTFYPPNSDRVPGKAISRVLPLKSGRSIHELVVDPATRGGTFELAIWGRRIPASECAEADQECRARGYRLEAMAGYAWGAFGEKSGER